MSFDQNKPGNNAPLVSADVRNNFVHIKSAISKEHGWDDTNPANSAHRLDQINVALSGSRQGNWAGNPVINGINTNSCSGAVLTQIPGVVAGTYTLQNALQELVNRSHVHGSQAIIGNCDCCGGGN